MELVRRSTNGRAQGRESSIGPLILVPAAVLAIKLLEEGGINDVKFIRTDTNDGA